MQKIALPSRWNDINLFQFVGPELRLLRRHMDLRESFCDAFSWVVRGVEVGGVRWGVRGWKGGGGVGLTKQEEQKHVTICHVPPGHWRSSRRTLGCVFRGASRSGRTYSCRSSSQVPLRWDQPSQCPQPVVWDNLTCQSPIWMVALPSTQAPISLRKGSGVWE